MELENRGILSGWATIRPNIGRRITWELDNRDDRSWQLCAELISRERFTRLASGLGETAQQAAAGLI
jgi:hypothetical protein